MLDLVQPITRRGLRNLHSLNCGIAAQHQLKVRIGFEIVLQSSDLYPEPISRDLHHRPKRARLQANRRRCPCKALPSNDTGLGGSSILHYDYKRNQTAVQEIRKFQPCRRLVKDSMVGQADVLKIRAKGVVVTIRQR